MARSEADLEMLDGDGDIGVESLSPPNSERPSRDESRLRAGFKTGSVIDWVGDMARDMMAGGSWLG